MTNPPQPLESCNSREEIKDWLMAVCFGGNDNWDDNVDAALKRMEEVTRAKSAPGLRETWLRPMAEKPTFQYPPLVKNKSNSFTLDIYFDIPKDVWLKYETGERVFPEDYEGWIYPLDLIRALAAQPTATGGEVQS